MNGARTCRVIEAIFRKYGCRRVEQFSSFISVVLTFKDDVSTLGPEKIVAGSKYFGCHVALTFRHLLTDYRSLVEMTCPYIHFNDKTQYYCLNALQDLKGNRTES